MSCISYYLVSARFNGHIVTMFNAITVHINIKLKVTQIIISYFMQPIYNSCSVPEGVGLRRCAAQDNPFKT